MLCAALDYRDYAKKRGRYSIEKLNAAGGVLATPDRRDLVDDLQPADCLIFHTPGSCLSWAIMYYTDSVWSHVAVVIGPNRLSHATTAGIIEQPISDFFDGETVLLARRPAMMTPEGVAAALAFAEESKGAGYNWFGVFKLFGRILVGASHHYRVRVSVDILLVAAALAALSWGAVRLSIIATAVLYVLAVVMNTPRRRRLRRQRA
jgi:hypothetical protein